MHPGTDADTDSSCSGSMTASLEQLEELVRELSLMLSPIRVPVVADDPKAGLCYGLEMLAWLHCNRGRKYCRNLIDAIEEHDFWLYGMTGRALIEHSATIRYYGREKMAPLFESADFTVLEDAWYQEVADIMNQFFAGTRFDWRPIIGTLFPASFLAAKAPVQQVNVLTCLKHWARELPQVERFYGMFCDMVHPNLGSILPYMEVQNETVWVGGDPSKTMGVQLVEQSRDFLVGVLSDYPRAVCKIREMRDFIQKL
jgi:hypothetical protein